MVESPILRAPTSALIPPSNPLGESPAGLLGQVDRSSHLVGTSSNRMRISSQHGLDPMADDHGEVGVIDRRFCAQMGDVAVPALMRADI